MRNLFRKEPPYITISANARPLLGRKAAQGDGLWVRCENEHCRELLYGREFENNLKVCHKCEYHARLSARERIQQLLDEGTFRECDSDLEPRDPLGFVADGQAYAEKLEETRQKTGLQEAALSGSGSLNSLPVEIVASDFAFIGGSMGAVVGEKIVRAVQRACDGQAAALITCSASGGARQQEGIFGLMQMAKTASALGRLARARVPHISVLTDPTLGGVTASYAGVGDVIIVEQGALVGFAGPRVIEQITKQKLPPDAQRAAFLLEHGMTDMVLARREIKPTLARLIRLYADAGGVERKDGAVDRLNGVVSGRA